MKRYLMIANYDGDKTPLKDLILDLSHEDPESQFYLVVPATPPRTQTWTWSEQEAYKVAKRRLDSTLCDLKSPGANLSGAVVNFAALPDVEEVLKTQSFDELSVATLPEVEACTRFKEFEEYVRLLAKSRFGR